jgi:hypothetical protein
MVESQQLSELWKCLFYLGTLLKKTHVLNWVPYSVQYWLYISLWYKIYNFCKSFGLVTKFLHDQGITKNMTNKCAIIENYNML